MKKKRLLLPSALLGALLFAAPAMAQTTHTINPSEDIGVAQVVPSTSPFIGLFINVGTSSNGNIAWYDTMASGWEYIVENGTVRSNDTFMIGAFEIVGADNNADGSGGLPVFAIATDAVAGKYTIGNFSISGNAGRGTSSSGADEGSLEGLVVANDEGAGVFTDFTGTINTGTIDVTNTGTGHTNGLSFAGNFAGTLNTGDITVSAANGDIARGFVLWGTFTDASNFNIGNILVGGDASEGVYGISNRIIADTGEASVFTVKNIVMAQNDGLGSAMGVLVDDADLFGNGAAVTVSGVVVAINTATGVSDPTEEGAATGIQIEGNKGEVWVTSVGTAALPPEYQTAVDTLVTNAPFTVNAETPGTVFATSVEGLATAIGIVGNDAAVAVDGLLYVESGGDAQGIGITGDDAYVSLSGGIIAMADENATGINVIGDDALIMLASSAAIAAVGSTESTSVGVTDSSAGHVGTLILGDADGTFTNGGFGFRTTISHIGFEGNAQLAEGVFDAVEGITVGSNQVDLGNAFGIVAGDGLTIEVEAGGIFQTVGEVNLNDASTLFITGGGRANLLGDVYNETADVDYIIDVEGGSTLAVDGTKIGWDAGGSVTFDLTGEGEDTNRLEVYGEVIADFTSAMAVDLNDERQVVSKSIFGQWYAEDDGGGDFFLAYRRTENVNMEQGFLTAGLIRQRNTGYHAVSRYLISAQPSRDGYRGQWCDPCEPVVANPCDPCGSNSLFSQSGPRNAWVNYVGRGESFGNWNLGSNGVQVGSDLYRTNRTQFGVFFGYEGGWAKAETDYAIDRTDRINSDDLYLGFYGARVLRNGVDARVVYNHGWQKFDMVRNHSANIYGSDFKGRTNEVNLEIGKRVHDGAWSLRPLMGLDILNTRLNAAQETWLNDNEFGNPPPAEMSYNKVNFTQVFLRAGVDVNFRRNRFGFHSGLSYAYDVKGADITTRVASTIDGNDYTGTLRSTRYGRQLVSFNVGGDYQLRKNFTVFGGYTGLATVDRSGGFQSIGQVGGAWKW